MLMEYIDEAPEARESAKLVTEGFTILDNALGPWAPILFGEGKGLSLSVSLLVFGFEKSFIFDRSVFNLCSFSGGSKLGKPGDSLA